MSFPKHPIITFSVNLTRNADEQIGPNTNPNTTNLLHPDRYDSDADRGQSNIVNHRVQKSTWLPGFLVGENIVDNHDGTITAHGGKATYLKNTYSVGTNAILTVTNETFDSA